MRICIQVPVVEIKVSDRALNKVRWTADGRRLVVGDSAGDTYVYEVPQEVNYIYLLTAIQFVKCNFFQIALPRQDEVARMESKLAMAVARSSGDF